MEEQRGKETALASLLTLTPFYFPAELYSSKDQRRAHHPPLLMRGADVAQSPRVLMQLHGAQGIDASLLVGASPATRGRCRRCRHFASLDMS